MKRSKKAFGDFYFERKENPPNCLISHDETELMARTRPQYAEHPTVCNICGGNNVQYVSNALVYGRQYGSGYCYLCRTCRSFVGTHEPAPDIALGILADPKLRDLRKKCHTEAERLYVSEQREGSRKRMTALYFVLGQWLCMSPDQMHFAKMQEQDLMDALTFMQAVKSFEYIFGGHRVRSIEMKDGSILRLPLRDDIEEKIRRWERETNATSKAITRKVS